MGHCPYTALQHREMQLPAISESDKRPKSKSLDYQTRYMNISHIIDKDDFKFAISRPREIQNNVLTYDESEMERDG